jgi:hypothetical protein
MPETKMAGKNGTPVDTGFIAPRQSPASDRALAELDVPVV